MPMDWNLLGPIYSGIISALVGYLIALVRAQKKKIDEDKELQKAEREALGALLRHDMYAIYKEYRDENEVPDEVQKEMHSLWCPYHRLGFNNMGDKIHDEIMNKPTKV